MGRSVDYLSRAAQVAYFQTPSFIDNPSDEEEGSDYFDFDDFVDDLHGILKEKYPSIWDQKDTKQRWDDNETRVFAENNFAEFAVSEYCGLISVSVRSKDYNNLGQRWAERINLSDLMAQKFDGAFRKIGTFSNGEGIYESVK